MILRETPQGNGSLPVCRGVLKNIIQNINASFNCDYLVLQCSKVSIVELLQERKLRARLVVPVTGLNLHLLYLKKTCLTG